MADDAQPVTRIISGDSFALSGGDTVRLEGIKAPDEDNLKESSRQTLEKAVGNSGVTLKNSTTDRYGRVSAQAFAGDASLQEIMVKSGQAFVYPPLGTEPDLPNLLKLEASARKASLGIWSDAAYDDITPDSAIKHAGQFAFVRGTVEIAERVKNKVYLNFGADWHTAFTVEIAARNLRAFKKAGIDPLELKGKTVRVRGLVQRTTKAIIEITDPSQMEILANE